jgi:opacity protein-like surface antigen
MKLRTLMLAGVAALLASPAFAGEGWYLGLGAGWDRLNDPRLVGAGIDGKLGTRDSAIVAATFGYKFGAFRIEGESAWDRNSTNDFTSGTLTFPSSGHAEVRSFMINGLYDIRLLPRLRMSIGAGAGIGNDKIKFDDPFGPGELRTGTRTRFMWQGIGGFSYAASRDLDLFVEYHYRDLRNGSNDNIAAPLQNHDLTEMLSWRASAGMRRRIQNAWSIANHRRPHRRRRPHLRHRHHPHR